MNRPPVPDGYAEVNEETVRVALAKYTQRRGACRELGQAAQVSRPTVSVAKGSGHGAIHLRIVNALPGFLGWDDGYGRRFFRRIES